MPFRVDKLRAEMSAHDLDSYLVTDLISVCYLSGFTGSTASVLITKTDAIIITDFRYAEQVAGECPGMVLELVQSHWAAAAQRAIEKYDLQRIGFEAHNLNYHDWSELNALLFPRHLVPAEDLVGRLRYVKDDTEIDLLREAVHIADLAYDHIISFLKPGIMERDVALELEHFMRKNGAEKEAFESIVASGPRSALPHGRSSDRKIGEHDLVVMDYGAVYKGYHSDITRTVMLGKPDDRQEEVYGIVLEAQLKAIATVRPGLRGGDVDAVARDFIANSGYGEHFGHGLGHGIGLEVHDGRLLARRSEIVLEAGMVVTVEPGIYLPGWGGVRIEDDVLVTDTGAEILTKSPKILSLGYR